MAEELYGRENLLSSNRALVELGLDFARVEPLAVRGARLSLARITARFGNSSELVGLQILELDDAGLASRHVFFDEDDLDRALDELDDRFIIGEGAAHADVLRAAQALDRLNRSGDFDAMRDLLSPDVVLVDHRPLAFGEGNRDHLVRAASTLTDLGLVDLTTIRRTVHLVGRALLGIQQSHYVTEHESRYEEGALVLGDFDSSYRCRRIELFAEEDFDAALARLDELGGADPTRPTYLDNSVLRLIMVGGTVDPAGFADDLVVDDRRSGVSLPQLHGSEEAVQASQAQEALFGPTEMEPVATRGDRLALVRTRSTAESGFELVAYGIFETNDDGRISAMVFFDETDLDGALSELNARVPHRRGGRAPRVVDCRLGICRRHQTRGL